MLLVLVLAAAHSSSAAPRRVVICTDIASDIDDAWALAFAMKCPELEIDSVAVSHGPTPMRGKVAAKLLHIGGMDDVPVLVGKAKPVENNAQRNWAREFVPKRPLIADAPRGLARRVLRSDRRVTLITLGPLTDIGRMLDLEPGVKRNIDEVIVMGGSISHGLGNSGQCAEYNILGNVKAARTVFESGLPVLMVGLDVTHMMQPSEADMKRISESDKPLPRAMYELYKAWGHPTPTLFDPVAVAVAFQRGLVKIEPMCIRVDGDGFTRVDPGGTPNANVCVGVDKPGFMELFTDRVMD